MGSSGSALRHTVSKGCGFPSVTTVGPYGAAFTSRSRTEGAKNQMCDFGP